MNKVAELCKFNKSKSFVKKICAVIAVTFVFILGTVILLKNFESTAENADSLRIKSFKIGTQVGKTSIDDKNHTIDIKMPYETNIYNLTPSIELYDENSTVSPGSGTTNDFSSPVIYTVTDKNGNKTEYTVTVQSPRIPISLFAMKNDIDKATIEGMPDSCQKNTVSDLVMKLKLGHYGDQDLEWYIAGANDKSATLYSSKVLLDTKSFLIKDNSKTPEIENRPWSTLGKPLQNTINYGKVFSPGADYPITGNHYGASSIRASLKLVANKAFEGLPKGLIKPTVLSFTDNSKHNYTVSDDLFLPGGTLGAGDPLKMYKIHVSDDTGKLTYNINTKYTPYKKPGQSEEDYDNPEICPSWLCTPSTNPSKALVVNNSGDYETSSNNLFVQEGSVINGYGLVPACNVDISSVYFLSAAPYGQQNKFTYILSDDEEDHYSKEEGIDGLLTFRYKDESIEPEYKVGVSSDDYNEDNETISVEIKSKNNKDDLSKYILVIQGCEADEGIHSSNNQNWFYEKHVNKSGKLTLDSSKFEDTGYGYNNSVPLDECRVWVEKNDSGRIYASTPKIIQAKPQSAPTIASISEVDETGNVKVKLDKVDGQQYACVRETSSGKEDFNNCIWDNGEGEFSLQVGYSYSLVSRYKENKEENKLSSGISEKTSLEIKNNFTITYSSGLGGIIKPYEEDDQEENSLQNSNSTEEKTCDVEIGKDQWFSIIPDKGKQVKDIKVDDQNVGKYLLYKFNNVNADHKIEVIFENEKSCWVKDSNDNWRYKQGAGSDPNIETWVDGIDIDGNKSKFAVGWINDSKAKDQPRWFHCDEEGYLETDWIREPENITSPGKWYYLNTDENNELALGQMMIGWFKDDDNSWYFFNDKSENEEVLGEMEAGWVEFPIGSNQWYYMNEDDSNDEENLGKMVTGWYKNNEGNTYYLSEDNENEETYGRMQIGWLELNNDKYYFNSKGIMLTGKQRIAGKIYVFGSDGKLQNG